MLREHLTREGQAWVGRVVMLGAAQGPAALLGCSEPGTGASPWVGAVPRLAGAERSRPLARCRDVLGRRRPACFVTLSSLFWALPVPPLSPV